MKNVITRYLAKFDEINVIADSFSDETTADEAKDIIHAVMTDGYLEGFAAVGYQLFDDLDRPYDIALLTAAMEVIVGGETTDDRIEKHIRDGDVAALRNVTETEFHRMYILGGEDRAQAVDRERAVGKSWVTVGDSRVRETHRYLEGITLPLDGEFFTVDGDHASAPGLFERVENNARCRCILSYRYL